MSLNIVLAEDNDALRELATRWLSELGYRVVAVADGPTLVQACRTGPVDVVVSDVRMPHMDGLTAAVVLRRELGLPVVLVSGSWTPSEMEQAAALSAVVVCKPYRPLDLLVAIARAGLEVFTPVAHSRSPL